MLLLAAAAAAAGGGEAACAGSSMENYPLYGEAHAALSQNCEETHTKDKKRRRNLGLFNELLLAVSSHSLRGGISASLHCKHKRKSKSFQQPFGCKTGSILIDTVQQSVKGVKRAK